MASALINVPAKAKRGDVIEIKTLMSHIMETGYRRTATGGPGIAEGRRILMAALRRVRRWRAGDRGAS